MAPRFILMVRTALGHPLAVIAPIKAEMATRQKGLVDGLHKRSEPLPALTLARPCPCLSTASSKGHARSLLARTVVGPKVTGKFIDIAPFSRMASISPR